MDSSSARPVELTPVADGRVSLPTYGPVAVYPHRYTATRGFDVAVPTGGSIKRLKLPCKTPANSLRHFHFVFDRLERSYSSLRMFQTPTAMTDRSSSIWCHLTATLRPHRTRPPPAPNPWQTLDPHTLGDS